MTTSPQYPGALITDANMPTRGMWGDQPPEGMWPDEYLVRLKNEVLAIQTALGIDNSSSVGDRRNGYKELPLHDFRLIEANDIPAIAVAGGNGGQLGRDTAPKLQRVNAATDKQTRIEWAAASVIEVQISFLRPVDLDPAEDAVVHLLFAMGAGPVDTPTVAVGWFEGVGDTNAGGNTAAVTGAAIVDYTRTIAAVDIGDTLAPITLTLIPAAHGTDELYLYGAYLAYRKVAPPVVTP